jgi:hypothetical protein
MDIPIQWQEKDVMTLERVQHVTPTVLLPFVVMAKLTQQQERPVTRME